MKDKVVLSKNEVDDDGNLLPNKYSEVEIALTYVNSQSIMEYFVNNINTYDGGTHVSGFRTAFNKNYK